MCLRWGCVRGWFAETKNGSIIWSMLNKNAFYLLEMHSISKRISEYISDATQFSQTHNTEGLKLLSRQTAQTDTYFYYCEFHMWVMEIKRPRFYTFMINVPSAKEAWEQCMRTRYPNSTVPFSYRTRRERLSEMLSKWVQSTKQQSGQVLVQSLVLFSLFYSQK